MLRIYAANAPEGNFQIIYRKNTEKKIETLVSGDFVEKRRNVMESFNVNEEIQKILMTDENELQASNFCEHATIGIDLSKDKDRGHAGLNPKIIIIDEHVEAREVDVKILEPMEPSISVKRKVSLIGRFTQWLRGLFEGIA